MPGRTDAEKNRMVGRIEELRAQGISLPKAVITVRKELSWPTLSTSTYWWWKKKQGNGLVSTERGAPSTAIASTLSAIENGLQQAPATKLDPESQKRALKILAKLLGIDA